MSKKRKQILSLATLIFLVAAFAWYISANWSNFQEISLSNPWFLLPAIGFVLINLYSIGSLVELAIEPHGVKLSKNEIFGLSSLTRFANNISPGYLGAAIRAMYLKKNYNVSYAKFSSSFVLSNVLQFLISGVLALLVYILEQKDLFGSNALIIVMFAIVLFAALVYLPVSWPANFIGRLHKKYNFKILERLHEAAWQYDKVRSYPYILWRTFFWMLVSLGSSTAILVALYNSLGLSIGILPAIFIAALAGWTMIFSITPASIGIREGLMVLAAQLMGVSVPITLAVAILFRLLTFVIASLLATYYAPKLLNTTLLKIKNINSA